MSVGTEYIVDASHTDTRSRNTCGTMRLVCVMPFNGVGERCAVTARKTQRHRADLLCVHRGWIERHHAEWGACGPIDIAAERLIKLARHAAAQPQRFPIGVVREPRREDHVALMREVDPPARLRSGGGRPPQPLVVVCGCQLGLRSPAGTRAMSGTSAASRSWSA